MIDILIIFGIIILALYAGYNMALLRLSHKMRKMDRELEKSGDTKGKYSQGITVDKQGYVQITKRVNPSWYARLRNKLK